VYPLGVLMFLSVAQVAKRYGINHKYVYDLVAKNVLPSVKFKKPNSERPVIRVPIAALEAWESSQLDQGAK
jgi:excisionase family DNA binding protein